MKKIKTYAFLLIALAAGLLAARAIRTPTNP
jgi:hypothetical protein